MHFCVCVQRLLPRMSYLPLYLSELAQYFSSSTLGWGQEHMWMEHEGLPLRWHLPVGVIYDAVVKHDYDTRTGKSVDSTRARTKPWKIVVHFQNFPADSVRTTCDGERASEGACLLTHSLLLLACLSQILRCKDEQSMERLYIHSLKQAQYLLYGSLRVFNELQSQKQTQLWQAVKNASQSGVDQVLSVLKSADNIRHVPVRCIIASGGSRQLPIKPTQIVQSSSPTAASTATATTTTTTTTTSAEAAAVEQLAEDIQELKLGGEGDEEDGDDVEEPEENKQEAQEIAPEPTERTRPTTMLDAYKVLVPHVLQTDERGNDVVSDEFDVLVQGIRVPLDAPLLDVWQELRCADMYLYICVVRK